MIVLKYICAVIALLATLIFVSNIITNISSPPIFTEDGKDASNNYAALRLILAIIMSLTWPVLFIF